MELPGFFRYLLKKGKSQQEQVSAQSANPYVDLIKLKVKYQKEELAKQTLVKLYTSRESTLADLATDTHQSRDVDSRRFAYDMGTRFNKLTGDVLEAFEAQVLSSVNGSQRRHDLRIEALNSAKVYWEKTLVRPDNPSDLIMLGRRRLTQITQRLEEFTRPPEAPK